MSAARAAARNKPVIIVKSGRSPQERLAAASHMGALAGSDRVFDAALGRAGMLRVNTLQELFLVAQTLARFRVIVRPELKGQGLGLLLMNKMIAYLRAQRTQRLEATVLDHNTPMLKLAKVLEFEEDPAKSPGDGMRKIILPLT